jgi:hypothetical protein
MWARRGPPAIASLIRVGRPPPEQIVALEWLGQRLCSSTSRYSWSAPAMTDRAKL